MGHKFYLPSKKVPLFSEVAQEWLDYKKPNLRITSWEVCRGHVKNHFIDLDNLKISRISVATIEKYIRKRQVRRPLAGWKMRFLGKMVAETNKGSQPITVTP